MYVRNLCVATVRTYVYVCMYVCTFSSCSTCEPSWYLPSDEASHATQSGM